MKPNIIFFSFNLTFGLVSQNVLDTEQINAVSVERMKKKFLLRSSYSCIQVQDTSTCTVIWFYM